MRTIPDRPRVIIALLFKSLANNDPGMWMGLAGNNWNMFCVNNPVNFLAPFGLDNINLIPSSEVQNHGIVDGAGTGNGEYTVGAHGTPNGITGPDGRPISAADIANMIKNDPNYNPSQPVRLNACSTGGEAGNGRDNFAQQLADALGNTVIAPTQDVSRSGWRNPFTGNYSFVGTTVDDGGKFVPFHPRK